MHFTRFVVFLQLFCCFCSFHVVIASRERLKRATSEKPRNMRGTCGGSHSGRSGYIASPNFPSKYPSRSNCTWSVRVARTHIIKIEFTYVDMEDGPIQKLSDCGADSIAIMDEEIPDKLIGGQKYCGYDTPFNPVFSNTSHIKIKFISDEEDEKYGFVLRWSANRRPEKTFNCDFEFHNGLCLGWEQEINDDFDWILIKGKTPSGKRVDTGPKVDHTHANKLGTYAYIEGSKKKTNQRAILFTASSKRLKELKQYCLRFWYHMRGDGMGSLLAYIIHGNGSEQLIFEKHGDQGSPWHLSVTPIAGQNQTIRVKFVGVRGSNFKSDMAIDDVSLSNRRCPQSVTKIQTIKSTTATLPPTTSVPRTTTPLATTLTTTLPSLGFTTRGPCPAEQYQCKTSNNCIPYKWFCDGTQDCQENEDEEDCNGGTTSTTICQPWSDWSECTQTCGTGTRQKQLSCMAGNTGKDSVTVSTHEETCNTDPCPAWTVWGKWSSCSATCNGGHQTRRRICRNPANGTYCEGPSTEIVNCNGQNCPKWGEWSAFSTCPVTCGPGNVTRTRVCLNGETGKEGCLGPMLDLKACDKVNKNHSVCDACVVNPCLNGGSCKSLGNQNFVCLCPSGYGGKHCENGETIQCFTGFSTRFTPVSTNASLVASSCPTRENVCQLTSAQAIISGFTVYMDIAQCSLQAACNNLACDAVKNAIPGGNITACTVKCCQDDLCNTLAAKASTSASTSAPLTTNPTFSTKKPTVRMACPRRNPSLAKMRGRICKPLCSTDAQCSLPEKCLCDGPCGKSCSNPDIQCRNITANLPLGLNVNCNRGIKVGSKCTFSCNANMKLVGLPNLNCQATEQWDKQSIPSCVRVTIQCPKRNLQLAKIRNRICADECTSDQQCTNGQTCNCDGPCGKTCSNTNIKCPMLQKRSTNIQMKCTSKYFVGSKCTFKCPTSHKLVGYTNLNCQSNAKWDKPKQPLCHKKANTVACRQNRPAHDKCCGKASYNSKRVLCCSGRRRERRNGLNACCSSSAYNTQIKGCCTKTLFSLTTQQCCNGKVIPITGGTERCCNGRIFTVATHYCDPSFGGRIFPIVSHHEEEEEEEI